MKKNKPSLDEQLLEAFYARNLAESDYNYARHEAFNAELRYKEALHSHDQAFYAYVKFGGREYYEKEQQARVVYDNAIDQANRTRLNMNFALCKFKKADRVYTKLKKKSDKLQSKHQPGGED